jgi:hypothetical protein
MAIPESGLRRTFFFRFLLFQLVLNLGFGAVIAAGLYLIGIPYAYIWGALAAVLRYIPFLGGWIAAAFPLLASLVMPEWTPFFLTGLFFRGRAWRDSPGNICEQEPSTPSRRLQGGSRSAP